MAKLNTQTLTIKISKLTRDDESCGDLIDSDTISQLESIITELAGSGVLVEVSVE
jgi:hypothetical protein